MNKTERLENIILLHQSGDIDHALMQYEDLLADDPDNSRLLQLIGITHAQQGNFKSAASFFKQSIRIDPKDSSTYNNLATCYKRLGDKKDALKTYQKALKKDPNNPATLNNIATLLMEQQDDQQAKIHLEKACELSDGYPDPFFNLGLIAIKNNDKSHAIDCFQTAHDFGHGQASYQLGQIFEEKRELPHAKSLYLTCLKQLPNHALAEHGLARTLLALQEDELALKHFINAQKIDPKIPHLMENMASFYHVKGMYANAIEYWSKAPLNETNIVDIKYNIGVSYHFSGRHDDALEYFNLVLQKSPNHAHAHINIAAIALQNCQPTHAIKHYKEALRIDPENEEVTFILSALEEKSQATEMPDQYITNLFDQYANHYESHLTGILKYQLPEQVELILNEQLKSSKDLTCLDLGCGTGLMGPLLAPYAKHLIGIDLSDNMLKKASLKGCYHELKQDNCLEYLKTAKPSDCIIAAELLPYFGDLTTLIRLLSKSLNKKGILIISIETSQTDTFKLTTSARFCHNPEWVIDLAKQGGLHLIESTSISLRLHQTKPVSGTVLVFTNHREEDS